MKLSIISLALWVGLLSSSRLSEVRLERGDCPMFWYSFNGRCYKFVSSYLTWADAELQCVSQKANLVSIHSLDENNFVETLIQNSDPLQGFTWIGLSDLHKEGSWMWSDGSPVDFSNWITGEPNNKGGIEHCGHFQMLSVLTWNDCPCSRTYPSVCKLRV